MNNAVFGKSMEDIRRRFNFNFVTNKEKAEKLAASPLFKDVHPFHENLIGVAMLKKTVNLCKPIFNGACILDLSKLMMADFHYNTIKGRYGNKANLLFTDTDSLAYIIETEDLYQDMQEDKHLYDFSDYSEGHFLHSDENKKVVGKMKDEMAGKIVYEFVGLRAKMYSFLYDNNNKSVEKKVCKGITQSVRNNLKHENYLNTLINEEQLSATMTCFRSYDHQNYTIDLKKVALSPYDNKKFRLNAIYSRSYGHHMNDNSSHPITENIMDKRNFGTSEVFEDANYFRKNGFYHLNYLDLEL